MTGDTDDDTSARWAEGGAEARRRDQRRHVRKKLPQEIQTLKS